MATGMTIPDHMTRILMTMILTTKVGMITIINTSEALVANEPEKLGRRSK
jgi:hypothetical protein